MTTRQIAMATKPVTNPRHRAAAAQLVTERTGGCGRHCAGTCCLPTDALVAPGVVVAVTA